MIVSWNELQRTCQKAFRGLGVPAGADDDSAFAVLWLQSRGFDALTPLDAALSALECASPRPLRLARREGEVDRLDAGGQPAVSIASDALDFAVARAVEGGTRAEVLLVRVKGGSFVAGALARRPMSGCSARVEWWDGETQLGLDVASDGTCRLSAAPPDRAGADGGLGRETVRILVDGPGRARWMEWNSPQCVTADDAELERRTMHSVTHGIDVPDGSWTRLLAFAKQTLVPATNASRERGAGGGEYND